MKIDTKKGDTLKALGKMGFEVVREREHIILKNSQGTTLSIPNHKRIKGSTISTVLRRGNIDPKAFFAIV
jgi:predicted RNA binding protein YcfA (HicA-like mRNA interferase family)